MRPEVLVAPLELLGGSPADNPPSHHWPERPVDVWLTARVLLSPFGEERYHRLLGPVVRRGMPWLPFCDAGESPP